MKQKRPKQANKDAHSARHKRPKHGNMSYAPSSHAMDHGPPRRCTVSVAIPGGIIFNAQSAELRTYLVGQIARACTLFCVDEIIVYDDGARMKQDGTVEGEWKGAKKIENDEDGGVKFMARVLEFLETPQ